MASKAEEHAAVIAYTKACKGSCYPKGMRAALEAAEKARGERVVYEGRPPGMLAIHIGDKFIDWLEPRDVLVIRKASEGGE